MLFRDVGLLLPPSDQYFFGQRIEHVPQRLQMDGGGAGGNYQNLIVPKLNST